MKTLLITAAALTMSLGSFAQHTQTESKTKDAENKAMLDGKAFVITLSENTPGSTGKPANMSGDVQDRETGTDQPSGKPAGKAYDNSKDQTGKKMMIRFENGMVKTSGKDHLKVDKCTYNSWGMESTGISFSADCSSNSSMKNIDKTTKTESATTQDGTGTVTTTSTGTTTTTGGQTTTTQITGTVNGDTIHGTMACTKPDGSVKSYSFTGTQAGPNDLDMEREMGLR
jgi:hypothetical protein